MHLHAGAFNMHKRLEMFQKISKDLSDKNGVEPDATADFSFLLGDFNSRFKTKFSDFVAIRKGVITDAYTFIHQLDELRESLREYRFPNYLEPDISFKPTYKCATDSNDDDAYINKKEQCPSFTDRILFKNNTVNQFDFTSYNSLADVFESDHRPVCLQMKIQLNRVKHLDAERLYKNTFPY